MLSLPPVTRTFPLASSVALWPERPAFIIPVIFHVPLAGRYTSAKIVEEKFPPPAIRTFPSRNSVVVWPARGIIGPLVAVHNPVTALYSSALVVIPPDGPVRPPQTNTFPFGSRVAL